MLIDTHAHLNFAAFDRDRDAVIKRCLDGSAGSPQVWFINVGTDYETSKKAVEIAEKYSQGIYAAIGLHPINLDEEYFDYEKYKKLALGSEKVKAIGEIGLDYYYKPKTKRRLELFKQKQKELLSEELKLAEYLNLPVIFHCRMAHNDLIEILRKPCFRKIQGVIHCFTGAWEQAQKYLEMGFYLGFNGIIFKLNLDEVIKKTSLDRILIETDCPFLTPPLPTKALAKAGGRNEPLFVRYIAEHIAKIKNTSFEKIAEITFQNAKTLFKI
jgi:TatD DNase family protein